MKHNKKAPKDVPPRAGWWVGTQRMRGKKLTLYQRSFQRVAGLCIGGDGDGMSVMIDKLKEIHPQTFGNVDPEGEPVPLVDLVVLKVFHLALFSEDPMPYMRMIFDRLYGKPTENMSLNIDSSVQEKSFDEIQDEISKLNEFFEQSGLPNWSADVGVETGATDT